MTILGTAGDVSVEDRATECMTAIARSYEEGLAHLAFLLRVWETPPAPPVPALPVMIPIIEEPAEPVLAEQPVLAEEPVLAEVPVLAEEPAPADEQDEEPAGPVSPLLAELVAPLLAKEPAMLPLPVVAADVPADVSPDAPTAVELPVVVAALEDEEPAEDARVLHLAEAVTAEIPVQAAA